MKNKFWSKKSQILFETVITIGIAGMFLGAIILASRAMTKLQDITVNEVIASNLAREGLEVIFSIKENGRIGSGSWPYGLNNGSWIVDYNSDSLIAANNSNIDNCDNCWICQNSYDKISTCSTEGIYKRLITISDGQNPNYEKKVVSQTIWLERALIHRINLEMVIRDWK